MAKHRKKYTRRSSKDVRATKARIMELLVRAGEEGMLFRQLISFFPKIGPHLFSQYLMMMRRGQLIRFHSPDQKYIVNPRAREIWLKSNKKEEAKAPVWDSQCQGYRRHGGAFTLGPVRWEQCKEQGVVLLTVEAEGERTTVPACLVCWKEAVANVEMTVIAAEPI